MPRSRASLLGTTALATSLALIAATVSAQAGQKLVLPQGGSFVAGSGAIAANGGTLTINQTSFRGIIDWRSFSISRNGSVQFNNGAGATLNRVTGSEESRLFGTLAASGSVYLLNPNGVLIGKSGSINTGGSFVASTLDTDDGAFMAGGALTLAGSSAASVKNEGTIKSAGGDVFLVARSVENDGSIGAANGTAGLAAGQQVLLQPAGSDQRIFIQAPGGDVTNTGTIAAAAAELTGDSFGGLDSNNTAIWDATLTTLPAASVTQSGNRYLFALQPTLTVTASNVTKALGNAADLSGDYTVSGLQSGVTGAYRGDSTASVFNGAPSLSSAGAAASANAGSYPIAISQGSLAALNGYAFAFVGAQLTVQNQFTAPTLMPPNSGQLLGQLQVPSDFSEAALLANLAPRAGCTPMPDGQCLAPLAAATFPPLLLGSNDNRAAPVNPW